MFKDSKFIVKMAAYIVSHEQSGSEDLELVGALTLWGIMDIILTVGGSGEVRGFFYIY